MEVGLADAVLFRSSALDPTQTIRDRSLARTLPGSRHCSEQQRTAFNVDPLVPEKTPLGAIANPIPIDPDPKLRN
jgi:hypothetical protein